ncbi:MAG TPA: ABC transporter permease subunit [Methylomirabilota bacterium]|jgi:NitT/TauT family transport system permease protein|nr:ABC transporter permease subunit [Methylomirabilota bacterium]
MWGEAPGVRAGRSPLLTAASLALWCVVWEAVGRAGVASIVPPLSRVVASGMTVLASEKFAAAAWLSLRTFALGMALAVAVGIPLGVLMARAEAVSRILRVWVNVFVSAPVSALVPILMAVLGIGETTVVVTVFLFAVFVIVLDTEVGVRQASRSLVEMASCFGATRRDLYGKILLPAALPEILAGLRLGAIRGVKGVVIGQLLVAILGVGELFELYSKHFLFEEFWALVIVVFAFAYAVSEVVALIERRVEHYASTR